MFPNSPDRNEKHLNLLAISHDISLILIFFGSAGWPGMCRVIRPDMFGVTPFHLFLHLTIRPLPECR
ncbi:hypothetical protein YPPY101_3803 [Yersinia pestis PY-101]|nr:hypothetical protein YPPY03_3932 [Yersinia pestis PY-03]EIR03044.1 hypothetical protein YPPY06_3911 [Yersinia pestis PY-06]EIR16302.1 hypothetical protein YPPY09_3913 [Yersinia pestis PY-09]EIS28553.1 hypothetical protein YPPY56_3939 [Yersinia pestis PY-56]EIS72141.1 hypothetical protein YPPY65_0147 [Yersinia pestis PY-65]EIT42577.1 hypothetical protein YPPY101_3803 [Yersinia pestis PY-101]